MEASALIWILVATGVFAASVLLVALQRYLRRASPRARITVFWYLLAIGTTIFSISAILSAMHRDISMLVLALLAGCAHGGACLLELGRIRTDRP